jgi:predicted nucleic acid-binding protein
VSAEAIILDTNVFVAAGFNRRSAAARIVEQVRAGRLRMVWTERTRRETQQILTKIPPLSWDDVAALFRPEDCQAGETVTDEFDFISDPDDRKFAALSAVTGAVLLTNDGHLLLHRERAAAKILTPSEYWQRIAAQANSQPRTAGQDEVE